VELHGDETDGSTHDRRCWFGFEGRSGFQWRQSRAASDGALALPSPSSIRVQDLTSTRTARIKDEDEDKMKTQTKTRPRPCPTPNFPFPFLLPPSSFRLCFLYVLVYRHLGDSRLPYAAVVLRPRPSLPSRSRDESVACLGPGRDAEKGEETDGADEYPSWMNTPGSLSLSL
jgi:hypothetical protein